MLPFSAGLKIKDIRIAPTKYFYQGKSSKWLGGSKGIIALHSWKTTKATQGTFEFAVKSNI